MLPVCSALAQSRPGEPRGEEDEALPTVLVKTGLYAISGAGGCSLLRLTDGGMILVNGKRPGAYRALMAQVRRIARIADQRLRVLVVTDHRALHAGNQAQFAAAGIPVVAQSNVRRRLQEASMTTPAAFGFDSTYTLRLGSVNARLMCFGSARTDGDTVVLFPELKVLALGDLVTPDAPVPDYAAGGSLVGWGVVLGRILELDFNVAVPSAGPPATRSEVQAFKTRLDALVARASQWVKAGIARDELGQRLDGDADGWRFALDSETLDRLAAELASVP